MLDSLSYEEYAEQLTTKFQLPELETEIELVEVAKKTGSPAQEMFSLIFRGPRDRFLEQGIYLMRHETLGDGELFLVPVEQSAEGFKYEAGFNRLIKSESES